MPILLAPYCFWIWVIVTITWCSLLISSPFSIWIVFSPKPEWVSKIPFDCAIPRLTKHDFAVILTTSLGNHLQVFIYMCSSSSLQSLPEKACLSFKIVWVVPRAGSAWLLLSSHIWLRPSLRSPIAQLPHCTLPSSCLLFLNRAAWDQLLKTLVPSESGLKWLRHDPHSVYSLLIYNCPLSLLNSRWMIGFSLLKFIFCI